AEVVLASAAEGSRVTDMGEFSIKVTYSEEGDSGQSARIVLTGPFAPQTNYRVIYESRATTEDGKAVPGFVYENYASIDGTSFERDATKSFLDSFSLTVNMRAGYGTFSLDKYVTGPASDQVPAGSTFTVNLAYELPNGATQDSYPGWTAPGTLNDARTGGTASFEVTMGRKNVFVGPDPSVTFPAGTVVTLTEAAPSIALPEGYSWGEGLFVVGGVPTTTLTIADQQVLGAELTNQVRAEPSTFEVVKTASGAPGAEGRDYTFTYTCSDGTEGALTAKGDGQPVRATDSFEVGTTCTIAESTEGAEVSGYDLEAPLSQRVRVTAGTTVVAQASFTNTYTARTGTFTIAKTVAGDGDFSGDTFAFDYTCSEGTTGSLEAPGTGEAVSGPELPGGTTCEISEDAQSAAREGYSVDSELSASTVTISQDAPVAVSATNTYSQDTGTFSVAKSVAGDGDFSGDTFAFDYTCSTGESGTLQVPADGTAVTSPELPAGAQCEVSEQEGSAARQGYSVDTGLSATQVTVVAGEDTAVSATNTYSQDTGTFSVAKQVAGDGDFGGGSYSVTYQCTLPDGTTQTDTLSVTGGATVNGPSLPVGTQCTVSEEDASQAGYALATSTTVEGQTGSSFAIAKDATTAVVLTNTYTQLTGGFQVAKTVEGDASAKAPQEFVFDYTCTTEDGSNPSGEVRVKAGESAQVGVPVGECVVTERAADVDGADRSTTVTVDGSAVEGEQATVTVSEGSGVAVEVTNTYTAHRGTFSVAKKAEGAEVSDTEFSFSYTCTDGSQGMLSAKADGQAVEAEQTFPVGTECTVTENEGAAQVEGYDLAASGEQEVAVTAKGEVVATTFTNTYTAHTGTFSLTKVATGADDEIADKKFSFSYTCTDGSEGTLSVKAGETVSPDKQLPLGTTCTLVEDTEAAGIDGYTLTGPSKESLTAPIVNKDQVVALKAVNTYEKPEPKETDPSQEPTEDPSEEPTGDPTDGSSASAAANASSGVAGVTTGSADPGKTQASSAARPTGSLARTGATVLLPVAVALAAIAGGVALLRRRRS
ncbi:DUF5979 domain-containing protein, partial [Actinomyces wuliandei]|uniref:DUF5979 domain-containing protein n=1 Tax=Actinomyces wuliandei TaxID=2057743 RepID=UPI0015D5B001